ncbi:MAG: DUF899 domain-containing protein [Comamonadaceae bacterium]|nr:MAG: DUF899 domain-containing protein [Comamonadaceae bacterium]
MAAIAPLATAAELAAKGSRPYPGDSPEYRKARTELLAEEIELRRHIERVAEMRRALPPGGVVPHDYAFTAEDGRKLTLSGLFGQFDTLVTYTWMFGPQRKRPCPMCTALLGPLDGNAADLGQQVALAVIARSPVERMAAFKNERGWRNLKLYSTDGDHAFLRDYRGEGPDGEEWAALNVFRRDADGTIRHFWGQEMGGETADPGQDPRGAPDITPLWNILDMTPDGRQAKWYPELEYS